MEAASVYVELTIDELWLIRSVVRHELAQLDTWKLPPADRDLNHEIALLIAAGGGHLALTEQWAVVLDYCVPQDAKDVDGKPVGKHLLLKVCKARADLAMKQTFRLGSAAEPVAPSKDQIATSLQEDTSWQRKRRRQPRS